MHFAEDASTDAFEDPILLKSSSMSWRDRLHEKRCADCLGELRLAGEAIHCTSCGVEWSVLGSMPYFAAGQKHYHADVSQEHMRELIANTADGHWRDAFETLMERLPAAHARRIEANVLDESRALGLALLPLGEGSRVLDIGCGWGALSIAMANTGVNVSSLDLAPLRARFTQLRAEQEGLDHLEVMIGGDRKHLPFPDNHFDAVILNGVLEWTADSRGGDPALVYREYLREARRILKPGGMVYIGIENRTGLAYFRGVPEDHIELPFIALMPRGLANRYAQWKRGEDYRTHTHNVSGYTKLMRDAGFEQHEFFWPHPDYRSPQLVFELNDKAAMKRLLLPHSKSGVTRWIREKMIDSGLFRYLPHSYLILGTKAGER